MRVVIVDGHNSFIRQYVANPTMDVNGEPVGGAVGIINNVKSYLKDMKPDFLIVAWDGEGGSSKKRSVYSEYKAGRKVRLNREFDSTDGAKEDAQNMVRQFQLAQKYLAMMGICQIRVNDVEADDAIAYLVKDVLDENDEKIVVSTDKDMLQLIDSKCLIFNPLKKKFVTRDIVVTEHGVLPENYIFTKAFCGDVSDNISGIKGFGEKTMTKLFPMIAHHKVSFDELMIFAMENENKNIKYKLTLENRNKLSENIKLMNLSCVLLSANSSRTIRTQLNSHEVFNKFNVELSLIKDGLQFRDIDLFSPFKDYSIRRKYNNKTNIVREQDGE